MYQSRISRTTSAVIHKKLMKLCICKQPAKSIFGDCGGNMSGAEWGVITSPRFPMPYEPPSRGAASRVCNWFVTARPGKRLLLNFEHFAVEGHLTGK